MRAPWAGDDIIKRPPLLLLKGGGEGRQEDTEFGVLMGSRSTPGSGTVRPALVLNDPPPPGAPEPPPVR